MTPETPTDPAPPEEPAPAAEAPAASAEPSVSPPPPQQSLGDLSLEGDAVTLFDRFRAFEAELLQSGHACDRACRALQSMQRAVGRICELAESSDEQHRCHDASRRYAEARDRVRVTCRTCPEGPALDADDGSR